MTTHEPTEVQRLNKKIFRHRKRLKKNQEALKNPTITPEERAFRERGVAIQREIVAKLEALREAARPAPPAVADLGPSTMQQDEEIVALEGLKCAVCGQAVPKEEEEFALNQEAHPGVLGPVDQNCYERVTKEDPAAPWTDPISGEVNFEMMEQDLGISTGDEEGAYPEEFM